MYYDASLGPGAAYTDFASASRRKCLIDGMYQRDASFDTYEACHRTLERETRVVACVCSQ